MYHSHRTPEVRPYAESYDYPKTLLLPGSRQQAEGSQVEAIEDIVAVVLARAAGHLNANFFRPNFLWHAEDEAKEIQREYRLAPTIAERFELFFMCDGTKSADLGILVNNGRWLRQETQTIEEELAEVALALGLDGLIDPHAEEAALSFHMLAGTVNDVHKINLRHRRTLFATEPMVVYELNSRGDLVPKQRVITVDKMAEHSLDLEVLSALDGIHRHDLEQLRACARAGNGKLEIPESARPFLLDTIANAEQDLLVSRAATIYYTESKVHAA
jgi:hypothetical protein